MILFSEGYRIFFAAAVGFALVALSVWLGWWGFDLWALPTRLAPMQWHAHEMVFGYGQAVLAGFFLTAVPNWTGAKGAPARFLVPAFAVWAVGRGGIWVSDLLPPAVVALLDLAFLPVIGAQIALQLIKSPKPQQLVFLLALALIWTANLWCHLEALGILADGVEPGIRAGLLGLVAMILILGGRVTPGFTRNAMVAAGRQDHLPRNPAPLAILAAAPALALVPAVLLGAPDIVLAGLAVLAGTAGLVRVALWRGGWTRDKPILWTLHLSYALAGLGLLAFAGARLGLVSDLAALHVLGIGAVGGMTVSVLTRASLGHSGRPLVAPRHVAWAYGLLPLAVLARCLGAETGQILPTLLSGGLWVLAFALVITSFWPVWSRPRLPRAAVRPVP